METKLAGRRLGIMAGLAGLATELGLVIEQKLRIIILDRRVGVLLRERAVA